MNKGFVRAGALLLAAMWLVVAAWNVQAQQPKAGQMVTTDGTNKKSPIKIVKLDFSDSTTPGATFVGEVRTSVTIQNSSKDKTLNKVTLKLSLNNLAGQSVQEWTKNVGVLKPGQSYSFTPDPPIWYNYQKIQVQPKVSVEHEVPPDASPSPGASGSPGGSGSTTGGSTQSTTPTPTYTPRTPTPKPTATSTNPPGY